MKCEHLKRCNNCKKDGKCNKCWESCGLFRCAFCNSENKKCEKGCESCNNNAFAVKPNMERCIGCVSPEYKNFECEEESKNMTDKKAMQIFKNRCDYGTLQLDAALEWAVKELEKEKTLNKPLTIAELEGMDGLPVWGEGKTYSEWFLINVEERKFRDNQGWYIRFEDVKAYKEKPSPRMVTINQAVDDKLIVRYGGDSPFMVAMESLKYTIERGLISGTYNLYDLFNEPCWEVDN